MLAVKDVVSLLEAIASYSHFLFPTRLSGTKNKDYKSEIWDTYMFGY